MCKYVKCWCVADDSSEYKRQVYTKSGGYSLNYGTDPPKWRAGAILCNKERYCSYMSSNLPLSFHWPYISPRRVASMNFCRRLWKSSGSFLFIWIVSMRTLRYNSGNELKFFQRGSSCFKASNISGIISNSLVGYWARPASVILPRSSTGHKPLTCNAIFEFLGHAINPTKAHRLLNSINIPKCRAIINRHTSFDCNPALFLRVVISYQPLPKLIKVFNIENVIHNDIRYTVFLPIMVIYMVILIVQVPLYFL